MKMRLIALATLIVVLTAGGVSGQTDCPEITEAALENVIKGAIPTGDNPSEPTVSIMNFRPVCLAYSQERDRYRYVSVVVEYTCTLNANCPSGTAIEQFESQCDSGTWSHNVQGNTDNTRTRNPTATFSTTAREDCAFCFAPALAADLSLTTDNDTHCVACDSSCDEGLMRCYGRQDTQCCQYYNDTTCVDTCPSGRIPDDDFNCVCPSGTTGDNCSKSCPQYCAVCDADPSDCEVCETGYVPQGSECKCSINLCSVCDTSASICDVCEGGYKLSNNTCICPVDNCDDCTSDVTKCDLCRAGYTYDTATSQCRRDCNVNNCSKCDADPDTCEECASDYKLEENECKCPVENCEVCDTDVTKCDECSKDSRLDDSSSRCIVGDGGNDDGGGLSVGAIIGIVIAAIVAAIILAAIIISAIILVARKIHSDKISIKDTELEAQASSEHLNPMYVKPEEVVDKGAPVGNSTDGAQLVGEESS